MAVITDTQTGGHGSFMTNPAQRADLLKIYTFSMHEKYPRKKFFTEIKFAQTTCLGTNQGVFQKEVAKGYQNSHKKCVTNVKDV